MSSELKQNDTNNVYKEHLGIVVVGHVDAGKSTTTGRLLYELGGINDRDLDKLTKMAKENGKESFKYAYALDTTKNEQQSGITINSTTKQFFTEKYHYTVIDAPGHRDFIKNMISGASQADIALLMIPANKGGFEKSIAKSNHKQNIIEGQTRQHARLCNLLGIDQLIVCINKMDDISCNYSQKRFNEIKNECSEMLKKIYGDKKVKKFPFIPISGFKGDNLTKKSSKMNWYNGWEIDIGKKDKSKIIQGYTLLDALNNAVKPPKRSNKKSLRMPVSGVYKIRGVGDVICGRIEQGSLSPGVNVKFYPTNCGGKVFSIEMHKKSIDIGKCGDNVGVNIRGLQRLPKVGDIMCIENEDDIPPKPVKSFSAAIYIQDHPGQLKIGFTPVMHVRTAKVPCKLIEIKWKRNMTVSKEKINSPLFIEKGDESECIFEPLLPFVVEPFGKCKPLGRLAGMDQNNLVLLGKVIDVKHSDKKESDLQKSNNPKPKSK